MTRSLNAKLSAGLWLLMAGCSADPSAPAQSLDGPLTSVEEEDFVESFAEAACYCEQLLLGDGSITTESLGLTEDDDRLTQFVRDGEPCSRFSLRPIEEVGGTESNGCAPPPGQMEPISLATGNPDVFPDGFCRAEFNYCLAQELRIDADSLASAPRSRAVYDELLGESRERYQASAVEMTAALGFYGDFCPTATPDTAPDARLLSECTRLDETAYPRHAMHRLSDAVTQVGQVLEDEAASAMAAGDGLSPVQARTPQEYVDLLWGASEGARFEAAQRVMGRVESTVSYGRVGGDFITIEERGDGGYADTYERDAHVRLALDLMIQHDLALGLIQFGEFTIIDEPRVMRLFPGEPPFDQAPAIYNLLDHRIAATFHVPPYALEDVPDSQFDNSDPDTTGDDTAGPLPGASLRKRERLTQAEYRSFATNPLPEEDSILRNFYGIKVEHVEAAQAMLRTLLETMELEYRTVPQVEIDEETTRLSVRIQDIRQPPIARLAAALQGHGELRPDAPDDIAIADSLALTDPTSDSRLTNWYDFDFARVQEYGAAGSLQMLRVHLLRLQNTWLATDPSVQSDSDALDDTAALVDSYIGPHWTEYKRRTDQTCACNDDVTLLAGEFCATLDEESSGGYLRCRDLEDLAGPEGGDLRSDGSGRWDVFFEPTDPRFSDAGGTAAIVKDRDEAFCLRFGHRPDGSANGCQQDPEGTLPSYAILSEEDPPHEDDPDRDGARTLLGMAQRRFVVPDAADYTPPGAKSSATAYIFWRTGDPDSDSVDYELVDVIQPRREASVHAFGGEFGDVFRDVTAKDPLNPGRPAMSSIGLPYDFVPPLENELSADGSSVESSHAIYLDNAERAASHASRLMQEARDAELESLRNDRADTALLDEAQQAERETVAESCGTAGGCDLERREELRLGSLTVDGRPFVPQVGDLAPTFQPEFIFPAGAAEPIVKIRNSGNPDETEEVPCSKHVTNFVRAFSLEDIKFKHWDKYVNDYMIGGLACSRWQLLTAANAATVQDVPEAVIAEILRGGNGDFSDSSGQVREILITMFQDLMNLHASLRGFQAGFRAAVSEVEQAAARIDEFNSSKGRRLRCKIGKALAVIGTVVAGVASSVVTLGAGAAGAVVAIVAVATTVASSTASVIGTVSGGKCNGKKKKAAIEVERTLASTILALENLQGITDETRRAAGRMAIGDARIDRLQRRVELAGQRREIRKRIIDANSLADLQEWQALQTFKVERARRALRRSQQMAFVARRGIEFRLGDDLATMSRPEPFVEAPGIWANDLFTVDTASSAMGAEDMPGTAHTNVSGEAMVDYVQQLGDFVRGYPFERRFRDATDVQMLRLDNLARNQVEFEEGDAAEEPLPFWAQLIYECNDVPASIPGAVFHDAGRAPCSEEGGVANAEFTFLVPKTFQGYLADRLATGSFNYRHQRMAFNFVGTSIIDCTLAVRPFECYADGNLQYSFEQGGAVFVENFEREKHLFFPGPTRITRGRALVAERVLTNPLSSADRGLISPFERIEFNGRPLRGVYTLTIHGRPEIRWQNLETVQWMIDYRYWTRQD